MLKKIIKSLLSVSVCSLLFTGMVFAANPATSNIQTYNGNTISRLYNLFVKNNKLTEYFTDMHALC